MARIGVDFGFGKTGVALLDDSNNVLEGRLIVHRSGIFLARRREMRRARRRNEARRRRMRDFYALLKGMGLEPSNAFPGQKMREEDRILPGNRLYAAARRRGWDYAQIGELLVEREDDKPPAPGAAAVAADRMLVEEYGAPAEFYNAARFKNSAIVEHAQLARAAELAVAKYNAALLAGETPPPWQKQHLRFVKPQTEFLGEWARVEKELYEHIEENSAKESKRREEKTAACEAECEAMRAVFAQETGGVKERIEEWMRGRLRKIYGAPPAKEKEITANAMAHLGLRPGGDLFAKGKIYRPHKNRHRVEVLNDIAELLDAVFYGAEGEKFNEVFAKHFDAACRTRKGREERAEEAAESWRAASLRVRERAEKTAQIRSEKEKRKITAEDVMEFWKNAAEQIVNRAYRVRRFDNRNVGKCPARRADGERCGKNTPRRNRPEIRKLMFEIELRRAEVLPAKSGDKTRKLSEAEIAAAMEKIKPARNPGLEERKHGGRAVSGLPLFRGRPHEPVGVKSLLRGIAFGPQSGRAVFCTAHLLEKLDMFRKGRFDSADWTRLHGDKILTAEDVPPTVRQKVMRVVKTVRLLLQKHNIAPEEVKHVGLETVRININSLSWRERGKSARHNNPPRGTGKHALARRQNGLCLLCGKTLDEEDVHIARFSSKARGGENTRLNFAAVCGACSINTNNRLLAIESMDKKAAEALRQNDPLKAAHLERTVDNKETSGDEYRASKHTMWGGKILRHELQKMLNADGDIFREIHGRNTAILRERWFPRMSRQKRALRECIRRQHAPGFLAFTAGKESVHKIPPNKHLLPPGAELRLENNRESGFGWLRLAEKGGAPAVCGAPPRDGETTGRILISAPGAGRVELDFEGGGKTLRLQKSAGEEISVLLNRVSPKEWREYKTQTDSAWLKVSKYHLSGTVPDMKSGPPVLKEEVFFYDGGGEIIGAVNIAVRRAHEIHAAVAPSEEDNIRKFHHILDASVLAANIRWDKITPHLRNPNLVYDKVAEGGAPDFSAWLKLPQRAGELSSPKSNNYTREDKENKSRMTSQKYDQEPYAFAGDENGRARAVRRVPLPKIKRRNVHLVVSPKLRGALKAAWEDIGKLSAEERKEMSVKDGGDEYIAEKYFTGLEKGNILHPSKTRSARCGTARGMALKIFEPLPDSRWGEKDVRPCNVHYFRRTVAWEKTVVRGKRGRLVSAREKHPFYWKDKNVPEYEGGAAPEGKERAVFRRGDIVRIKDERGRKAGRKNALWKIIKLAENAKLSKVGAPEILADCVYTNLSHARKKKRRDTLA